MEVSKQKWIFQSTVGLELIKVFLQLSFKMEGNFILPLLLDSCMDSLMEKEN